MSSFLPRSYSNQTCVELRQDPIKLDIPAHGGVGSRSNAYLHNGAPPVATLRTAGVRLALGTDSSASNADLSLFAEATAVRALDPGITAEELLRMVTLTGAELLGVADSFGALRPGAQADLVVVRASDARGSDPTAAFLEAGAAGAVEAVMAGGEWRIRDCVPTADTSELTRASDDVRAHARELIASE